MSHICLKCNDTGSLSKLIDADLDCHYCEATEKRRKLRAHLSQFTGWPDNDAAAWAAYLFAQRQAAPVAAQPAMPKLPSTPEEMVSFIGSHFDNVRDADDLANVKFQVSVHDLMSCFRDWFDLNEVGEQPAQPEEIDFLAMEFPRSTLKAEDWDPETKQPRKVAPVIAQPAQQVEVAGPEPVAYMQRRIKIWMAPGSNYRETDWEPVTKEDAESNMENIRLGRHQVGEFEFQPLYAAPQPAAQPSGDVARAAVLAERSACAAIADSVNNHDNPMTARDVADAIRARK